MKLGFPTLYHFEFAKISAKSSPHKKRPILKARFPVHVVLRVAPDIGSLRKRKMYGAIREATIAVALPAVEASAQPGRLRVEEQG